jgi:hypothetical protein
MTYYRKISPKIEGLAAVQMAASKSMGVIWRLMREAQVCAHLPLYMHISIAASVPPKFFLSSESR